MELPVGYHAFHQNAFFNYQFNRLHSLGYGRLEDILEAAGKIRKATDFPPVFQQLAEQTITTDRKKQAAMYFRIAEFFVPVGSTEKQAAYDRFIQTFYEAFGEEGISREKVPYEDGFLPGLRLPAKGEHTRGTFLIFGGFDSLIEEFYCLYRALADAGYDVIALDGPGQGGALRTYGLKHTHAWERPLAAVLDHYKLDNVTLAGISMGGYWVVRAAAFEKRVTRLIVFPPVYDWLEQIPAFFGKVVRRMARWRRFMNWSIRLRTSLFPILDHAVKQALDMSGGKEPVDAVHWFLGMNSDFLHSDQVQQDVLLLGGEKDRFQPPKLLRAQEKALSNARSVTTRIFKEEEHAANHCQMGNFGLAITCILEWVEGDADGLMG